MGCTSNFLDEFTDEELCEVLRSIGISEVTPELVNQVRKDLQELFAEEQKEAQQESVHFGGAHSWQPTQTTPTGDAHQTGAVASSGDRQLFERMQRAMAAGESLHRTLQENLAPIQTTSVATPEYSQATVAASVSQRDRPQHQSSISDVDAVLQKAKKMSEWLDERKKELVRTDPNFVLRLDDIGEQLLNEALLHPKSSSSDVDGASAVSEEVSVQKPHVQHENNYLREKKQRLIKEAFRELTKDLLAKGFNPEDSYLPVEDVTNFVKWYERSGLHDKLAIPPVRTMPYPVAGMPPFRHDPVKRFHEYQQEWTKFPAPGEKKHNDLRWRIREYMLRIDIPNLKATRGGTKLTYMITYTGHLVTMNSAGHAPFVLHDAISSWQISAWTPDVLAAGSLSSKKLRMRLGPKEHRPGHVLHETESQSVFATAAEFAEWLRNDEGAPPLQKAKRNSNASPSLADFDREHFWCYCDYKDMFELFDEDDDLLKSIDWRQEFGVDRDGYDSVFWMGSEGAYTQCHYDTYGFNLVAQIYGRKRWVLFPPSDTELLQPSRNPYEESSVFSCCDILCAPVSLQLSSPRVVVLKPGDVLYVPSKWWHSVQCLEPAISVNTWVPTSADKQARVEEAVVRSLVHLINGYKQTTDNRRPIAVNATEPDTCYEDALLDLNTAIEDCSCESTEWNVEDSFSQELQQKGKVVEVMSYSKFVKEMQETPLRILSSAPESHTSIAENVEQNLLSCLLHPETISTLRGLLLTTNALNSDS